MAVHLGFAAAGHSRVSEIILAGRTGYWPCDPEGGDFDLNDSVVGPWVATLKVTGADRVQWLDRTQPPWRRSTSPPCPRSTPPACTTTRSRSAESGAVRSQPPRSPHC